MGTRANVDFFGQKFSVGLEGYPDHMLPVLDEMRDHMLRFMRAVEKDRTMSKGEIEREARVVIEEYGQRSEEGKSGGLHYVYLDELADHADFEYEVNEIGVEIGPPGWMKERPRMLQELEHAKRFHEFRGPVFVKPHVRNGKRVKGYKRRRPRRR